MTVDERQQRIESYGAAADRLSDALKGFPRQMWKYKPGPQRWSIHETLLHIVDSEANSYIRCRCFLAEPGKSIMAYDEDQWAVSLSYHDQSADEALVLFRLLRTMSYRLIVSLPDDAWSNTVHHPENGEMRLDDWLTIYRNHVDEHIEQMTATHHAWQAEQEGRAPDPQRSLYKPLEGQK